MEQVRESGLPYETSKEKDVVIDRVHAVTIRASVTIEGIEMNAVVDTVVEVTVMSERRFQEIPAEKHLLLRQDQRSLVVAEAGRKMRTSGTVQVKLIMGNEEYVVNMHVAPIADDLFLGCNFLDEHDVTINARRGLEIRGKWVDCLVNRKHDKISRVLASETTTIPPSSEALILGKSKNSQLIDTCFSAIEPALEDLPDAFVAHCLVDPYKPKIPVRVVNTSRFPVKLKKDQLL